MASLDADAQDPSRVLQRITSATVELETDVKRLGGQSDGRELRDDLNSKKDAILADIQFMKSTLQITKKRADDDKSRTLNMRYDRMTKDFKSVVSKAEDALREYEKRLKEHPWRDYAYSETLTSSLTLQGGGPQQQVAAMDTVVALTERNQQLQQLHGNIEDLHDIGKNIAVMVEDQRQAVDNVEANVESAADHVVHGVQDLRKGSGLAKKKRYLIAAIVAILVGVLVVVVVVIVLGASIGCAVNRCDGGQR